MTLTVDSDLNGASPQFTLTCISTGGPATTVTWTRNSATNIGEEMTALDNAETATYTHTLTVTGRLGGLYQCTVSNVKPSEAVADFTVQGTYVYMYSTMLFIIPVIDALALSPLTLPLRSVQNILIPLQLLVHACSKHTSRQLIILPVHSMMYWLISDTFVTTKMLLKGCHVVCICSTVQMLAEMNLWYVSSSLQLPQLPVT